MLNPTIALNFLTVLSQYTHMVEVESEQKSTMSAPQRVGCFLQRVCDMHGFDPESFDLPYPKTLIASRLGMEPETFSISLNTLKKHGIAVKDMLVSFHDIPAAFRYLCEHCSMFGDCESHAKLSKKLSALDVS